MKTTEFKGRHVLFPSQFERVQLPRVSREGVSQSKVVKQPLLPENAKTFRIPLTFLTVFLSLKAYLTGRLNRGGFLTFRQLLLVTYLWRKGFLNYVVHTKPEPVEPDWHYLHLNSPFFPHITDARRPEATSLARGFSRSQAIALRQAVGECLERVPFLYYRVASLVTGSYAGVSKQHEAVDAAVFDTFTAAQRAVLKLPLRQANTVYRWQRVEKLTTAGGVCTTTPVLIPAQAVWRQYPYPAAEPRLAEFSVHGYAAHYTDDAATLAALYEWIERDGFFAYWLWGVAPPRIDSARLQSARVDAVLAEVAAYGYEVTCLDVSMPDLQIPAVFCVLRNPRGKVYAVGGAGCQSTLEGATYKALCEAVSMLHWSLIHTVHEPPRAAGVYPYPNEPFGDIERFTFWAGTAHQAVLASWLTGQYLPAAAYQKESMSHTVASLVGHLAAQGHPVYRYQAVHPVLTTLRFHAVRVQVPSLIPIYIDMRYAPLAHPRLAWAKAQFQSLGKKSYTNFAHFNNYPHLFP